MANSCKCHWFLRILMDSVVIREATSPIGGTKPTSMSCPLIDCGVDWGRSVTRTKIFYRSCLQIIYLHIIFLSTTDHIYSFRPLSLFWPLSCRQAADWRRTKPCEEKEQHRFLRGVFLVKITLGFAFCLISARKMTNFWLTWKKETT